MKDWNCTNACGCKGANSHPIWFDVNRKLTWFEVPRCASTAIRYDVVGIAKERVCTFERIPYGDHFLMDWSEYFTFGVTRNPWDRLTSAFMLFTCGPPERQRQAVKLFDSEGTKKFSDFARGVCHKVVENCHWAPVSCYLPYDLDFLIRFETFDADWTRLVEKVDTILPISGIRKVKYPKEPTPKPHYTTFYKDDDELIEMVGEFYKVDINRYNYSYGT